MNASRNKSIAGNILAIGLVSSAVFAGTYTITNSPDIWVDGVEANGKDIIDPAHNAEIDRDYGNITHATINTNAGRYVFGMDTSDFITGAGGSGVGPTSIIMTKAVSGADLTITMGTFQNLQSYALGQATSSDNSLNIGYYNYRNMTFDRAVETVGFAICRIDQPNLTANFYSDVAKTQLLASYDILNQNEGDAPDFRYTAFVAHTDTTGVGIRCVELRRPDHNGGSVLIDDLVVVNPSTSTGELGARITGLEYFSGDVWRMVLYLPLGSEASYPLESTDLVSGSWASVAHSTNGVAPWLTTNLNYSATEGTNKVIYVQSTNDAAFFGLGEL